MKIIIDTPIFALGNHRQSKIDYKTNTGITNTQQYDLS